jgi:3-aminobutyryl-CoA ammonia-lyase
VTAEVGASATQRRYASHADAHYGGGIAAGAFTMGLFGDVATELCLLTDGDEGLLAGYREVRFAEPVRAGDVIEVTATVVRVGRRSREVAFEARVVGRADPDRGPSAGRMLAEPLVVASARGTVVVPVGPGD